MRSSMSAAMVGCSSAGICPYSISTLRNCNWLRFGHCLFAPCMLLRGFYPIADILVDEVDEAGFVNIQFTGRLTGVMSLQGKVFRLVDAGYAFCYLLHQLRTLYRIGTCILKTHLQAKAYYILL